MNRLEIAFINVFSPYKVWNKGEILFFETSQGCKDFSPTGLIRLASKNAIISRQLNLGEKKLKPRNTWPALSLEIIRRQKML